MDIPPDSREHPAPVLSDSSDSSFRISSANSVYSLERTQSKTSADNTNPKAVIVDADGNPIHPDRADFYNLHSSTAKSSRSSFYFGDYRAFDDPNLDETQLDEK